ncbi:hypothetical protein F4824DRAFT_517282, partial [Ustulina deusta]
DDVSLDQTEASHLVSTRFDTISHIGSNPWPSTETLASDKIALPNPVESSDTLVIVIVPGTTTGSAIYNPASGLWTSSVSLLASTSAETSQPPVLTTTAETGFLSSALTTSSETKFPFISPAPTPTSTMTTIPPGLSVATITGQTSWGWVTTTRKHSSSTVLPVVAGN